VSGAVLGAALTRAARSHRRAVLPRNVAAIASPDNLPRILDLCVEAMQRPGLRGGAIFLINERNELYFGAHRGLADDSVRDIRLPVGQGIVGGVAAQGRSVLVGDLDAPPPGLVPTNRSTGSNALSRSMIAVPILSHAGVLGVLEMGSSEPHAFDGDDLALLEHVAAVIAPVVAQANPLKLADEVLRRRVRELTALQEAAGALNASLGLDDVVAAVAEHAARAMRTPYAAVHRVTQRGALRTLSEHQRDEERDTAAVRDAVQDALRATPPLAPGEVHTVVLPLDDGGAALPVTDPRAPLCTMAMVRLRPAGNLDVLVCVASPDSRGFDPAQLRLLEGVAHLATLAMANAVRYRRLAEVAVTDPLTGVLRRSEFEHRLAALDGQTVSVLAIDVDNLKAVNDSAGHEEGDAVLRAVAQTLAQGLGDLGILGRTGGDEFGILLPAVHQGTAVALAEELRRSVHAAHVTIPWLPGPASAWPPRPPAPTRARPGTQPSRR